MSPGKDSTVDFSENQIVLDIEIAMELVRTLNGVLALIIAQGDESIKNVQLTIAKEKLKKMKNPYARKMVQDKIEAIEHFSHISQTHRSEKKTNRK